MGGYFKAVATEMKDWKKALLVIVLTVARLIYGWEWLNAGIEKLSWLSDGKPDSAGLIMKMADALNGPATKRFDPLMLNKLFAWVARNIFAGMPGVTDFLVVALEIVIGIAFIVGIQLFWTALVSTFLNLQYITAGSANNFGYIWTNLVYMKAAKYGELLGIGGFIRYKKGKKLL